MRSNREQKRQDGRDMDVHLQRRRLESLPWLVDWILLIELFGSHSMVMVFPVFYGVLTKMCMVGILCLKTAR